MLITDDQRMLAEANALGLPPAAPTNARSQARTRQQAKLTAADESESAWHRRSPAGCSPAKRPTDNQPGGGAVVTPKAQVANPIWEAELTDRRVCQGLLRLIRSLARSSVYWAVATSSRERPHLDHSQAEKPSATIARHRRIHSIGAAALAWTRLGGGTNDAVAPKK